jgi:hypothetical protein
MQSSITPFGNLDQDSDVRAVKKGDYRDAMDVTSVSDSDGNTIAWEPKRGSKFAFSLGEQLSIQHPVLRIKFTDSGSSYDITLKRNSAGIQSQTFALTQSAAADIADEMANTASSNYNISVDPDDNEAVIIFPTDLRPLPIVVSSGDTQSRFSYYFIQDNIDSSMIGEFVMCGGAEIVRDNNSDLFVFSTTSKSMPEDIDIVSITVGVASSRVVTTSRPHGISVNELFNISGIQNFSGEWIASAVTSTTVTLYGATAVSIPGSTTGTLTRFSRSLSKITVAQEDINQSSDRWTTPSSPPGITSVDLLKADLGFRLQKRIHAYAENDKIRRSFYLADGYNKDRCLYYKQDEYVADGFMVHAGGNYDYNTIQLESTLSIPFPSIDFVVQSVSDSGGQIKSGNHRFAIRFKSDSATPSNFSQLTNIVNIYSASQGYANGIHGDPDGTITTKSIYFSVSNIPLIYKSFEIIDVLYSDSGVSSNIVVSGPITGSNMVIPYTGFQSAIEFDTGEINIDNQYYETSHSVSVLDGRMIRSNLKSFDINDFSGFFSSIRHSIDREFDFPATNSISVPWDNELNSEYRSVMNVINKKTFIPYETYRLGGRVKLKNGPVINQVFWIDDIRISDSLTNDGNPTDNRRNSTVPDLSWTSGGRLPFIYKIVLEDINWDYVINGKLMREIVDEIYIDFVEMTDQYREVLATGALIGASSRAETLSGTFGVRYGSNDTGNYPPNLQHRGPWTGSAHSDRKYVAGFSDHFFTNDNYFVFPTSPSPSTASINTSGLGHLVLTGVSPSTMETPDVVGLYALVDYTIWFDIDAVSTNGTIEAFVDGVSVGTVTTSGVGNYTIQFTASGDGIVSFDFGSLAGTVNEMFIFRDITGTPTIDKGFYGDVSNTYRNSAFFVSPDYYYDESNLSFQSGDKIVGVQRLPNINFDDQSVGTVGLGGALLYSTYREFISSKDTIISEKDIYACETIFPYTQKQVGGITLFNSTAVYDSSITEGNVFSIPKCLGIVFNGNLLDGVINENGIMLAAYYRDKGKSQKFGLKETSVYVHSGFKVKPSSDTVNVFGDAFIQGSFVKLRTPFDPNPTSYTAWGFGYGVNLHSFNRGNYQMEHEKTNGLGVPADTSVVDWLESTEVLHGKYTSGYSNRFDVSSQSAFNQDIQTPTVYPTRICYSETKPNGSISDEYRIYKPLNFRDLDISNGEIVHHEIGNGELLTWQLRSFERQFFNSTGMLQSADGSEVILGDSGALQRKGMRISNIGTSHKWSVVKGRSKGGNDIFFWFSPEIGCVARFGYDGTVPISSIQMMSKYARQELYWAKDKHEPSFDFGIHGIWDDYYSSYHIVGRGVRHTAGEWDPRITYSYNGTQVYVYVYENDSNGVRIDTPRSFRLGTLSSTNESPLTTQGVWEEQVGDYSKVNIDYSMIKSGFHSRHSWHPKTMLKWGDSFVYARPGVNESRVYIHNRGWKGFNFLDQGLFSQGYDMDPFIEMIFNEQVNNKKEYVAIELNSRALPDRIEFKTNQHESYLEGADFEKDEIHDDLWSSWIKNDSTVSLDNPSGLNNLDTSSLFGDHLLIKYRFDKPYEEGTDRSLFNAVLKFNVLSRTNNS